MSSWFFKHRKRIQTLRLLTVLFCLYLGMKKICLQFLACIPFWADAQLSFGVKGGLNFVNVTNAAGINAGSRSGYMFGGYISQKSKNLLGFRSEIMLSRQGYNYKSNSNTSTVNLDYLLMPQLLVLNFTRKFQVQAGGQIAFLMNAKVDSTGSGGRGSLFDYFNRFDYGLAGGIEIFPVSGLFLGGRINISLQNLNKGTSPGPSFLPKDFIKNNVAQFYAGWKF